jgi:hypothetical protein
MRKILLLFLFVTGLVNAQETQFTLTSEKGMTDYIVINVEGKTAPEIYKKAMEWIKVTYKNPDKVILSTIENEYIRFEGVSSTLYALNIMGKKYYDTKYQIEISTKDGKYKFDLISMENYYPSSQLSTGGWSPNGIFTDNMPKETLDKLLYKKDGSFKGTYKYFAEVPEYFNNLNNSLLESMTSTVKRSDGW